MRGELERTLAIAAEYLVMHPDSSRDRSVEEGMANIAASLEDAAKGLRAHGFTLLLENTAPEG